MKDKRRADIGPHKTQKEKFVKCYKPTTAQSQRTVRLNSRTRKCFLEEGASKIGLKRRVESE